MIFIANNFDRAAGFVSDLHKAHRAIEVFFKENKQILRLAGFMGIQRKRRQAADPDRLSCLRPAPPHRMKKCTAVPWDEHIAI